jgi:hypothetical protein
MRRGTTVDSYAKTQGQHMCVGWFCTYLERSPSSFCFRYLPTNLQNFLIFGQVEEAFP